MGLSANYLLTAVLLLLLSVNYNEGYRALFLAPVASRSHKNFFSGVAKALAEDGNEVTLVTPYAPSSTSANLREVVLRDADLQRYFPNPFSGNILLAPLVVMGESFDVCLRTLRSAEVQGLLREEEFDVVLLTSFFSDCYLSVVHQLKVPFIYVSPLGLVGPQSDLAGNPTFPSFSVAPVFTFEHPLTFGQRLANALGEVAASAVFRYGMGYVTDWKCRRSGLCPDDMPPVNEMRLNSSLVILNSVKNLETPVRPYVPGVVHAGGIHCREAEPLPQDLAKWVDEAGEAGFIFFSLGSASETFRLAGDISEGVGQRVRFSPPARVVEVGRGGHGGPATQRTAGEVAAAAGYSRSPQASALHHPRRPAEHPRVHVPRYPCARRTCVRGPSREHGGGPAAGVGEGAALGGLRRGGAEGDDPQHHG